MILFIVVSIGKSLKERVWHRRSIFGCGNYPAIVPFASARAGGGGQV